MAAVARFLDVPASTVRRREAGRLIANDRVLALSIAVAERTGDSLDWLLRGRAGAAGHRSRDAATSKVVTFPYWRVRLPRRHRSTTVSMVEDSEQ